MTADPGTAPVIALQRLDVEAVHDAARRLTTAAEGLRTTAEVLGADLSEDWTGDAARTAWTGLGERAGAAARAAGAFDDAGRALAAHARVLADVRQRVGRVAARADAAVAAGAAARAGDHLAAGTSSAAASGELDAALAAARRLVDEVEGSGAVTAAALRAAAALAPPRPGWYAATGDAVDRALTSAAFGAGEAVFGLFALVHAGVGLAPVRAAVDPAGHRAAVTAVEDGVARAVAHPLSTVLAALDLRMWLEDPARGAGRLLPDAVAAASGVGATAPVLRGAAGVRAGAAASAVGRRGAERAPVTTDGWSDGRLSLTPEQDAEARALAARAAAAEPRVTRQVGAVATGVAGRLLGLEERLKGLPSLQRKVAGDVLREPDVVAAVDRVGDTLRFTLGFDDVDYVAGAVAAMAQLRASRFVPVRWKNSWTDPSRPYVGLNTTWRDPGSSVVFEVQVHSGSSWRAGQDTHGAYERERHPGTPPEAREEAHAEQAHRWAQVPVPPGVEGLTAALVGLRRATPRVWWEATAPTAPLHGAALLASPVEPVEPDEPDVPDEPDDVPDEPDDVPAAALPQPAAPARP